MLESLENNELILLMYLAGELPPMDRQEVAQMLASDAGLCNELERLRETQAALEMKLAALDKFEPITGVDTAVRRVGRAMRQHQVDLAAQAARNRQPEKSRASLPFWVYPTAAAAAILVAFLIWVISFNVQDHTKYVRTPDTAPSNLYSEPQIGDQSPVATDSKAKELEDIQASFGPSTESDDNQMFALRDDPQIAVGSNVSE